MLVSVEDGSPKNYVLEAIPSQVERAVVDGAPSADEAAATVSYRIVCTNYEHAFAPDVAGKISGAHPMLFAKSVLFCMEQMFDPIHPEVQEYITGLDVTRLLDRWLKTLSGLNGKHFDMFGRIASTLLVGTEPAFVGVPLRPGLITELMNKLCRLQQLLRSEPTASHIAILNALAPMVGQRYDRVLQQPLTVTERFREVDSAFFNFTPGTRAAEKFEKLTLVPASEEAGTVGEFPMPVRPASWSAASPQKFLNFDAPGSSSTDDVISLLPILLEQPPELSNVKQEEAAIKVVQEAEMRQRHTVCLIRHPLLLTPLYSRHILAEFWARAGESATGCRQGGQSDQRSGGQAEIRGAR